MSNIETAAATSTEKPKANKVMLLLNDAEYAQLQKLRADVVDLGREKTIPSTSGIALQIFKSGLESGVAEVKEAKKASKAAAKG